MFTTALARYDVYVGKHKLKFIHMTNMLIVPSKTIKPNTLTYTTKNGAWFENAPSSAPCRKRTSVRKKTTYRLNGIKNHCAKLLWLQCCFVLNERFEKTLFTSKTHQQTHDIRSEYRQRPMYESNEESELSEQRRMEIESMQMMN